MQNSIHSFLVAARSTIYIFILLDTFFLIRNVKKDESLSDSTKKTLYNILIIMSIMIFFDMLVIFFITEAKFLIDILELYPK